jgi:hypothetical protein
MSLLPHLPNESQASHNLLYLSSTFSGGEHKEEEESFSLDISVNYRNIIKVTQERFKLRPKK